MDIELEYEQCRKKQIASKAYKNNDEYLTSYVIFLRRKGYSQEDRDKLVRIRTNRLLEEARLTPMSGQGSWEEVDDAADF